MRPVTSSVDWCEPNYLYPNTPVLQWIAEQFNTWSAIIYLIFSALYLVNAYQLQWRGAIDYVRPRFLLNSLGLLTVGVGTFLFHATLSREHQMLDEISMNFAIILNVYLLLNDAQPMKATTAKKSVTDDSSSSSSSWIQSYETFRKLTMLLTVLLIALVMYLYDQTNPLKFRTVFGVVAFSLAFFCIYKTQNHNRYVAQRISTEESRLYREQKWSLIRGIFIYGLTGFGAWMIERTMCFEPLKLHAWWHYLTSLSAYCGMYMSLFSFYYDTDVLSGKKLEDRVCLKWHLGMFPWIHGKPSSSSTTVAPTVAGKTHDQ